MRNFSNYQDLTIFSISENLKIAKYCLETPKKINTNSCYGMPALILLASVIDAIGMFYRNGDGKFSPITVKQVKAKQLGSVKSHFEYYYDKFLINNCEKKEFIVQFYEYARCLGIHNGTLNPSIRITVKRNKKGLILEKRRVNYFIFLADLFDNVKDAFEKLKKESSACIEQEIPELTTGGTSNSNY